MFGGQVGGYLPAYWFFEVINMLHKLFLCSIVVFFNSGSPEQFLIAIFEVVLFAGFVAILSPHNQRFETIMFIVVQFALLSILIRALVIKAQFSVEDGYDQETWNVVLNIIILIPIFIVVAAAFPLRHAAATMLRPGAYRQRLCPTCPFAPRVHIHSRPAHSGGMVDGAEYELLCRKMEQQHDLRLHCQWSEM